MAQYPRLDETDMKILNILRENSRTAISKIAEVIHMSQPAVKERMIKMKESNLIDKYTITLGEPVQGMVTFILLNTILCKDFEEFCKENNHVVDLHRVSGDYNYLVKVRTNSIEELACFQEQLIKYGTSKSLVRTKKVIENNFKLIE
ncbi:Lrp/AsnC family transcriptional regulator [Rummeliibacillus suwonensis]|uniref:Lrp/AsnC family transcriptional regulator n=1 Tax=Rummeliibacillus suwonensis TaxID=1306154 RepID=UPI001AAE7A7A|nr:Lrp/AsnC family transcriptional regulator [Rummeliibacillus suwonensis]MBO2535648.1 Lrp/AsnC family transcriptional regulator [Rummeliibacillus suwonensis]